MGEPEFILSLMLILIFIWVVTVVCLVVVQYILISESSVHESGFEHKKDK